MPRKKSKHPPKKSIIATLGVLWVTLMLPQLSQCTTPQMTLDSGTVIGLCSTPPANLDQVLAAYAALFSQSVGNYELIHIPNHSAPATEPSCFNRIESSTLDIPSTYNMPELGSLGFAPMSFELSGNPSTLYINSPHLLTASQVASLRAPDVSGKFVFITGASYRYFTHPQYCYASCATCQTPSNGYCLSCQAWATRDLTQLEQNTAGKGYCLCDTGRVNTDTNACDADCRYTCKACASFSTRTCYECATGTGTDIQAGTPSPGGITLTCTYTGPCHMTCQNCQGPAANDCLSCADWSSRGLPQDYDSRAGTYSCPSNSIYDSSGPTCGACGEGCGACTVVGDNNKCTRCLDTSNWTFLPISGGEGSCQKVCHSSCATGQCTIPNDATKCTACAVPADFELLTLNTDTFGPCRRRCHASCSPGACSESHRADRCRVCADPVNFEPDDSGGQGIGTCIRTCHSSCVRGQCTESSNPSKCTSCPTGYELVLASVGASHGTCEIICHPSCQSRRCSAPNDATKCLACPNSRDFELVPTPGAGGGAGSCRRICHRTCAPGQCSESHLANRCTSCADSVNFEPDNTGGQGIGTCVTKCFPTCKIGRCTVANTDGKCLECRNPRAELRDVDPATRTGRCVTCHETCDTCSTILVRNRCLTCKNLGSAGTLTLLNGECRCQEGTYFVEGQAKCERCHSDCAVCTGPLSTQCTTCTDKTSFAVSGVCQSIFNDSGEIKGEFLDRVVTPTLSTRAPEMEVPTPQNFEVGKEPGRLPSPGSQRKFPMALPSIVIDRIEKAGSRFDFRKPITITPLDGARENIDYTVTAAVSETKDSFDISFNMINTGIEFMQVTISFTDNNYFFSILPELASSSRILQELSQANQDLIKNTPLIANSTFDVKFLARDYDESKTKVMTALGVPVRIIFYLGAAGALIAMIVLATRSKTTTHILTKFLEFLFSVHWLVKIGFLPATYSIYELMFMDEIVKTDTHLMGSVSDEKQIRNKVAGKFLEYSIPVLVFNSATFMLALLLIAGLVILIIQVVLLIKKRLGKGSSGKQNEPVIRPSAGTPNNQKNNEGEAANPNATNQPITPPTAVITTTSKTTGPQTGFSLTLSLVLTTLVFVTPSLFFYSQVNLWWIREGEKAYPSSAIAGQLLSVIFQVTSMVVLVLITKRFCARARSSKNQNRVQQEQGSVGSSSGGSSGEDSARMITQKTTDKANRAGYSTEPHRDLAENWGVYASVLRYLILMVIVILPQNDRVGCLSSVLIVQAIYIVVYMLLLNSREGSVRIVQTFFEAFLTSLLGVVMLADVPANRVDGGFWNTTIPTLIVFLMYCCVCVKIFEFVVELSNQFRNPINKSVKKNKKKDANLETNIQISGAENQEKNPLQSRDDQKLPPF